MYTRTSFSFSHLCQVSDCPPLNHSQRRRKNVHDLHQLVNIPTVLRANRHRVWDTVQQIELLNRDAVDLVEHIDDRDVAAAPRLENINQVVNRSVAPNGNIRRADLVLAHDSPDLVGIDMRQRHRARDIQPALVLLLESNIRRLLVDPDAEPLQLALNHSLIRQRLVDIQHNEDQMARLGHRNDLTTTTTAVLCTLNNTGQVNHLQRRAVVGDLAGHRGQRRELVGGGLGVLARQVGHERALADRGESDEADTGDARARDIEACASAAAAARRGEEFALELGKFGFELAEMVRCRLVFLGPSHLLWGLTC